MIILIAPSANHGFENAALTTVSIELTGRAMAGMCGKIIISNMPNPRPSLNVGLLKISVFAAQGLGRSWRGCGWARYQ